MTLEFWDTPELPPANTSLAPQFTCDETLTVTDVPMPHAQRLPLIWDAVFGAAELVAEIGVKQAMNAEFERIWPHIEGDVTSDRTGYLMRVNCWRNEFGNPVILGSPIMLIGRGLEPVDALSMFYRTPSIEEARNGAANLTNVSYYIWMTRHSGQVRFTSIPSTLATRLDRFGRAEAARLDATQCFAPLYANVPGIIAQAEAFAQYSERAERALRNNAERAELNLANERLRASQDRLNQAVTEFSALTEAMQAEARRQSTLQAISAIGGLLQSAARLGQLRSSNAERATATPSGGNGVASSRARADYLTSALGAVRETHIEERGNFIILRDELMMIFNRNDVPQPFAPRELHVPELP